MGTLSEGIKPLFHQLESNSQTHVDTVYTNEYSTLLYSMRQSQYACIESVHCCQHIDKITKIQVKQEDLWWQKSWQFWNV